MWLKNRTVDLKVWRFLVQIPTSFGHITMFLSTKPNYRTKFRGKSIFFSPYTAIVLILFYLFLVSCCLSNSSEVREGFFYRFKYHIYSQFISFSFTSKSYKKLRLMQTSTMNYISWIIRKRVKKFGNSTGAWLHCSTQPSSSDKTSLLLD